jgi:hypothetical protein
VVCEAVVSWAQALQQSDRNKMATSAPRRWKSVMGSPFWDGRLETDVSPTVREVSREAIT